MKLKNLLLNKLNYSNLSEKERGNYNLIISLFISTILNYILSIVFNLDISKTTGISIYMINNIIIYILNIFFALKISNRTEYFLKSFINNILLKYVILCIIDSLICILLIKNIISYLDEHNILVKWKKNRDIIIVLIVPTITNLLIINKLRFDWCLKLRTNDIIDLLMYIWLTLVLFIFIFFKTK